MDTDPPNRLDDLRFAIASDIHLQYRPPDQGCDRAISPPEDRHAAFLDAAADWGADVVIDLGDLQPRTFDEGPGKQALDAWQAWPEEKIAVLGNHDDDIVDREEYMEKMGMPSEYYSKTVKSWTFIVLYSGNPAKAPGSDGEEPDREQLTWLREEIRDAPGRCIVLVHYGTTRAADRTAPELTKRIIDEANEAAGYRKVVGYFWGHRHETRATKSDGVYYVMINSTSYRWGGSDIGPIYYRDPAPFGLGVFHGADGSLSLEGTGEPDNWAVSECAGIPETVCPTDELTYQKSV